ncbi:MAG: ABC transporter ATP-binding protein [Rhodobacteraceae bacterium]|nr:ABC transporter ATP-binding protein [Paracoccaceae bacterium]
MNVATTHTLFRQHGTPRRSTEEGRIDIEDVSVVFGSGPAAHTAVERTSLAIPPGEFVCLLGPSGCGKSSLLNAIAGHVRPTTGAVRVDGVAVTGPGSDRGMVFQQYSLLPWKTIRENVALGPRLAGKSRGEADATAGTFLNIVGLSRYANRYPAELSGGMQQRVGIARALANYPSVLLMDEPFGALDAQTRLVMQENLLAIWKEFGTTVVFVTHDVDEAIFLADRVLVMSAAPGRVISDIRVPLPRPRRPEMATEPGFVETKRQCLAVIREQSLRAFENQER